MKYYIFAGAPSPSRRRAKQCRIVGLSASLANAKDVGDWIGATAHSLVSFRPDVRPVPLELKLHGFDVNHFGSRMLAMAKPAYNYVALGCAGALRWCRCWCRYCWCCWGCRGCCWFWWRVALVRFALRADDRGVQTAGALLFLAYC